MSEPKKRLSTEPYKGVRDFYPDDFAVQRYIFGVWGDICRKFGYEEYTASILEPAELYRSKTSDEIVNDQTYTFTDRGEREVTLRPEMTPTVARLIAGKRKTLYFPVRWFSLPNLFRYERPQRGRLREHYQLNADIFGVAGIDAETEIVSLAYEIMRSFGVADGNFEIRINSRKVMNYIIEHLLGQTGEEGKKTAQLIDRRAKMEKEVFEKALSEHLKEKDALLLTLLNSKNFAEFVSHLPKVSALEEALKEIDSLTASLEALGITNVVFDQTLMRGFDYYSGLVFEVFDKNPANPRSLFGGGRYDNLLELFDVEKVPTVGFGMGDVTIRDVLETYDLLPKKFPSPADIYLSAFDANFKSSVNDIAQNLRRAGVRVLVDYGIGKVGTKVANADRAKVPFFALIGEAEKASGHIKVKNLETGKEAILTEDKIAEYIKNAISSTL